MNKNIIYAGVISFIMVMSSPNGFADSGSVPVKIDESGKVTLINKLTDSIATIGKTESEKKAILRQRKELRRQVRLIKAQHKADAETKKRMRKQQDEIMKKVRAGEGY